MGNRRKVTDRRNSFDGRTNGHACSRRTRPDRRLKSIAAVWIPMEQIKLHPVTRLVFSRR